ncbi:MAG: methyltransferase domain-containing protein [Cyclobacteriaceae bacterium]|nr:methyltransferase domain-containing protein [Cyclobacteriaceae bacterium]
MAHRNQIKFLEANQDLVREPILIVGSKLYNYDKFDLEAELKRMGFNSIIGIDISEGPGVHFVIDIIDVSPEFMGTYSKHFNTIICMEVLTNVPNPFKAAENVFKMLTPGGTVVLSEVFVRKLSRMPVDYWRFSYDGLKALFAGFQFFDDRARFSVTRQRDAELRVIGKSFEEILAGVKHPDESLIGSYLRRIHRKYFSKGIFNVSRLMPEQTVYAVGRKTL